MKYVKLVTACVAAIAAWAALAAYLSFFGVWMSAVAPERNTAEFFAWAVHEVELKSHGTSALVLIDNGEVVKQHFGGAQQRVDEDTLFPTASYSKFITALTVMSLVENGKLDLDAPVSRYLTRWQLPDSTFDNDQVTARRLLSHTAGLTDGLGFGDYGADELIPTTEAELRRPRASSGANVDIGVGLAPGSEFLYSGGGYLILQLLVEEVSGGPFADYVGRSLLEPIGMKRSSYAFLGTFENVSLSYDRDGSVAPTYQYASPAATGFASSAADLAKLARAILKKNDTLPLKSTTIETMREPHAFVMGAPIWGLGTILFVQGPAGDFVFGHDGANDPAINATLRINPETSDAIVMLVSGHPTLASNIGSEWVLWQTGYPDFMSTERALKSAVIPTLIGAVVVIFIGVLWARRRRG